MRATTCIAGDASISVWRNGVPPSAMPAESTSRGRRSGCLMVEGKMTVSMSSRARTMSMPFCPIVCGSITLRLLVAMVVSSKPSLQIRDIAAIMRGCQMHLVHHYMLRQTADVTDEVTAIGRLHHLCPHLGPDRVGALIEDRRRDLARQEHGGADAVHALLHVQ